MTILDQQSEVAEKLTSAEAKKPAPRIGRKVYVMVGGGLALFGAVTAGWNLLSKPAAPSYSIAEVRKGTVAKTIHATGKVQAVTTVQVGSQVSGTVSELHADFNDQVKAGQVVARLDPSQLEAQASQARASLVSSQASARNARSQMDVADASLRAAQANVDRARSVVDDAQRTADRAQNLVKEQVMSKQDAEKAQAALVQASAQKQQAVAQQQQAAAQTLSAKAQWEQAQAGVQQSQSSLQVAEVNLEKSTIRSPIDGVVIARNVDVGQTVAASLQAPVLFLIAKDLTKMQVLADVDEADVGGLAPASKVSFTVDAFPTDTFEGRLSQIRLAPQTVQNVTTYTAVIDVDNQQLKLRPGMTASVTATVAERKDVLLVSNAALRFRPEGVAAPKGGSVVWKVDGEKLTPVRLRLGLSDGVVSEVVSGTLAAGDRVAMVGTQPQRTGEKKSGPAFPGTAVKGGRR